MNAAARFLIAFLSVLCVLCGKKSLPRFMAENGGFCRSEYHGYPTEMGVVKVNDIRS